MLQVAVPALSVVVEVVHVTPDHAMVPAGVPPAVLLTVAVKINVPPVAIEVALSVTVVLEGLAVGETGPSEPLEPL